MFPDSSEPLLPYDDLPWVDYEWDGPYSHVPLPDFLLISPGLSGRIYVDSLIGKHPDIQLAAPDFFTMEWSHHDLSWYGDHFRESNAGITGDVSESHVFLPEFAIKKLKALKPDLRIVFIMQDPRTFCQEFIYHQFFYGKGVFSRRDLFLEDVPDRLILECLIRDELLSRVDYESLIKRWSRHFPIDQIFIGYLEQAATSPDLFFSDLFDFFNTGNPDSSGEFPSWQYGTNPGLDHKIDVIRTCLEDMNRPRMMSFSKYLEDSGSPLHPWKDSDAKGSLPPVFLEKRKKNWRIFLHDGLFEAVHEQTQQRLTSSFLYDLRRMLSLHGSSAMIDSHPPETMTLEDSRLCSVITEQAKQKTSDKQKTDRLNQLSPLIEDYHLYNIIKTGGRFVAVKQSMGSVAFFREKLGEREISPHILRASTLDAVKRKIDHVQGVTKTNAENRYVIERWL